MLELSRIRAGHWEGIFAAEAEPALELTHLGAALPGLTVTPAGEGKWALSLPIPAEVLSDGVQGFVLRAPGSEAVLGRFAITAGAPLAEDLMAEIVLLRAELDLLKSAFRRHCTETQG